MPSGKKTIKGFGPSVILKGLVDARIEFILVGGLAAVAQGVPITTLDVDIVHRRTKENLTKLLGFLKSIDAHHRRFDDQCIEPSEEDISGKGHALLNTRLGPLDVLGEIENGLAYEALLDHTVELDFRGRKIHVLTLETQIELKKSSNDPKDRQRLPIFEETLRKLKQDKP